MHKIYVMLPKVQHYANPIDPEIQPTNPITSYIVTTWNGGKSDIKWAERH